jgi:UDP-N-acetylmuramoyl-L-alanyl-D-glutamate--2,6-diaminopimelate ligase
MEPTPTRLAKSEMIRLGDIVDVGSADRTVGSLDVGGIAFDSRNVKSGDVFFALAGANDDGLKHVGEAVANGAAVVVADRLGDQVAGARFIKVADARAALARAAARLFPRQPGTIVAVTGTSGKTSVAAFVRQIWQAQGLEAASLGTLGVVSRPVTIYGSLTTPDPILLHQTLDRLAGAGVTRLALEASSHGLDQKRLDGVRLAAGAFTNLTRDHLDYHTSAETYLAAKLRLFLELLPDGAPAIVDADSAIAARVIDAVRAKGLAVVSVGAVGETIRLVSAAREGFASSLELAFGGRERRVKLPLPGDFQIANALVAAGLCIATGSAADAVFEALQALDGAPGRLERIGETGQGATVFVDYAHKPDALEKTLAALRPYVPGRLIVVFGCGGDRDAGKRPIMGEIATRCADVAIVTDDNPRSENSGAIRAQILAGGTSALEVGDRAEAIRVGVRMLKEGDALLIAGKGHEIGQIFGDRILPFSDAEEARAALREAA